MSYSNAELHRPPRRSSSPRAALRSVVVLAAVLVLVSAIAAFDGIATGASASGWFRGSLQVVWTPVLELSRACWGALFLLVALAGWFAWRRHPLLDRPVRLVLYAADLVLLALWPAMYLNGYPLIGVSALWIAFAAALLLIVTVLATLITFWPVSRTAAVLLIPVLVWLVYVASVNLGDAILATLP